MQACTRRFCGGALVTWHEGCTLCGRTATGPRPPTAKEAGDKRLEKPNVTDYFTGVYHVDYVPSAEELSQAIW